jgi:hypothetical protein
VDKFILNVIHRPELVPEYIDREAQAGKEEELSKGEVVTESLDIFRLQQDMAHSNDLRTTIQMTFASLYNEEAIGLAREHHEEHGDEISLTFLGLNCKEFRESAVSASTARSWPSGCSRWKTRWRLPTTSSSGSMRRSGSIPRRRAATTWTPSM